MALKGQQSGIVDAHRDPKRFVVRADEKLTALLKMDAAIRGCGKFEKSVNANNGIMRAAIMLCVSDGVVGSVPSAVQICQSTNDATVASLRILSDHRLAS